MDKKLPKVFANRIDKKINNNSEVFYESKGIKNIKEDKKYELNVNQKINQIFSSSRYVYKADVVLTMKDKTITKKIIGRNKNHLITMDNDLINVDDIIDINFSK